MNAPFITTKNLYLQKEFPEESEKWLRVLYGAAADETLLCGVWTNPVLRKGFLVTDKALRWYVTTNGEKVHGALLKDVNPTVDFAIMPALTAETASAIGAKTLAEELSRLEMTADGRTFTFFMKGLTEDKGKTLCDILKFGYMQGEALQADVSTLTKTMPLLALRNFCDGDLNLLSSLADKMLGIAKTNVDTATTGQKADSQAKTTDDGASDKNTSQTAQTDESATNNDTATTDSNPAARTETIVTAQKTERTFGEKASSVLLSVLDVCASLVFIAAVVIAIKPQILPFAENKTIPTTFNYFEKIGNYVLKVEVAEQISPRLEIWRNMFVAIGLIFYSIFKLIVLLCSKNSGQKIVSALLLIMTLLACFLVTNKFLLFIAFCLLIYFAFQYSCGIHTKCIFAKLIIICILGCSGYICLSILTDDKALESYRIIVENVAAIKDSLYLRINWW